MTHEDIFLAQNLLHATHIFLTVLQVFHHFLDHPTLLFTVYMCTNFEIVPGSKHVHCCCRKLIHSFIHKTPLLYRNASMFSFVVVWRVWLKLIGIFVITPRVNLLSPTCFVEIGYIHHYRFQSNFTKTSNKRKSFLSLILNPHQCPIICTFFENIHSSFANSFEIDLENMPSPSL